MDEQIARTCNFLPFRLFVEMKNAKMYHEENLVQPCSNTALQYAALSVSGRNELRRGLRKTIKVALKGGGGRALLLIFIKLATCFN